MTIKLQKGVVSRDTYQQSTVTQFWATTITSDLTIQLSNSNNKDVWPWNAIFSCRHIVHIHISRIYTAFTFISKFQSQIWCSACSLTLVGGLSDRSVLYDPVLIRLKSLGLDLYVYVYSTDDIIFSYNLTILQSAKRQETKL